ncbi:MAG: aminotransferase class V-fold PLP-dependent enzyme [Planctomycetaceae bacterium]|nr:aminotransferase class V-fold PLP-dependent enzyme [Planctomycetaceae bacterium]
MTESQRVYLDNAATSWPKPNAVYEAVDRYQRQLGGAVGRGATRAAGDVQTIVDRCRTRAARLLGAESSERMIFTFNGTDGLNLAIHGLLSRAEGETHVVTTMLEHNSVLRPLTHAGHPVTHVVPNAAGQVDPAAIRRALRPQTGLVVVTHASNVTGAIQPIAEIGDVVRSHGAVFLVDAAQSAGHLPINLRDLPIDLLACSGHKGLLGPLGTGLLYVRPGIEERVVPVRQGGTGTQSEVSSQPDTLPDRYESGNHNAPGLVGLEAALAWIEAQGVDVLHRHERELSTRLMAELVELPGVHIYGPANDADHVGVVSFDIDGLQPQETATILDQTFGIEVRAGLHCAPLVHEILHTSVRGGTVRMSVGPFTTAAQVDAAAAAVREIAMSMVSS